MKLSKYTYFKKKKKTKNLIPRCVWGRGAKMLITVNFQEHRVGRLLEFC